MKKLLLLTAAFVAAVAILVAVALPPARFALATPSSDGTVRGIIHVHTNRSDGRGTPDEIAAAAANEGLRFVILTDHGDATRKPDPPVYRSGVLCLDAVEISTTGGHYLALDMPPSPYPLGGEARDVVEDVARLGGFGIVAHPDSPKAALSWRDWNAPFDAIEWVNPDTSWRVRLLQTGWRARSHLVTALAAYPFRPAETMARSIGGTTLSEDRWTSLTERRRIVLLGGADAHARLGFGSADPGEAGFSLPIPSYRTSFRTLSVHVRPESQLSGDAASDAVAIMQGLRRGHSYTAIDGMASPPAFGFTATNGREVAGEGDLLPGAGSVTLQVKSNAPSSFTTIIRSGRRILRSIHTQGVLTQQAEGSAVYRVEIDAPSSSGPIPWVVSNPIYVGITYPPPPPPSERRVTAAHALFDGRTASGWWTESDPSSVAAFDVATTTGGGALRLRYGLSGGTVSGQYVTLAVNTPPDESYDRLTFSARSERPSRLEVQLRVPGPQGARWQRSVYVDESDRAYTIAFDDMVPVGGTPATHPTLKGVRDVMFVIDTTHAQPGSSGRIWIMDPILQR